MTENNFENPIQPVAEPGQLSDGQAIQPGEYNIPPGYIIDPTTAHLEAILEKARRESADVSSGPLAIYYKDIERQIADRNLVASSIEKYLEHGTDPREIARLTSLYLGWFTRIPVDLTNLDNSFNPDDIIDTFRGYESLARGREAQREEAKRIRDPAEEVSIFDVIRTISRFRDEINQFDQTIIWDSNLPPNAPRQNFLDGAPEALVLQFKAEHQYFSSLSNARHENLPIDEIWERCARLYDICAIIEQYKIDSVFLPGDKMVLEQVFQEEYSASRQQESDNPTPDN